MKRIVLTGGPGAGKTAVLELARKQFPDRMTFIPEAASLIFSGGFWRHPTPAGIRSAQRAIYYVQREFERMVVEENLLPLALCDRGTADGAAYWPAGPDDFWRELGTTRAQEYERYFAVIHMQTPQSGYNQQNPWRTESSQEAAIVDARILQIWADHPRLIHIKSSENFMDKADQVLDAIRQLLES